MPKILVRDTLARTLRSHPWVSPRFVLEKETHSWMQGTIVKMTSVDIFSCNPGRKIEYDMELE